MLSVTVMSEQFVLRLHGNLMWGPLLCLNGLESRYVLKYNTGAILT